MEGRSLAEVTKLFTEILRSNGITHEVSEVALDSPASLKGAGMTSQPYYVTIKFADSTLEQLHLFVKIQPANSVHTAQINEAMKLFDKETRFFTQYVPAVHAFCKSKGQETLVDFYPKCYYGDGNMIVFENLSVGKHFVLLSKQEQQGLESSRLALAALAKHHAISYALIKDAGGQEKFFKDFPDLNFESFDNDTVKSLVEPLVENGISTNIKLLEKSSVEGKDEAVAILKEHSGRGFAMLMDTIHYIPQNEKILTLNHGDYWNNNMMFQKDPASGKLSNPVIFDFQGTRYNCPALDVGNFMFTSMKPEERRAHLEELLRVYFNTFTDVANKLGYPVELTYNEFYEIFCKKVKYGFWFAIWLAVEVGYAVINDVDIGGDAGVDAFSVAFDKQVQKWIDQNPEKSVKCAKDLVKLMKEYSNLVSP